MLIATDNSPQKISDTVFFRCKGGDTRNPSSATTIFCGFAKRSWFQSEVSDWRKQTKKSIILEKVTTFLRNRKFSKFSKNKVSEIFKISEVFVKKTSVSANWPSRGLRTHGWFPKKILTVTRISSVTALTVVSLQELFQVSAQFLGVKHERVSYIISR